MKLSNQSLFLIIIFGIIIAGQGVYTMFNKKAKQEEIDLTAFIDKVKKYTEIKELTPEIVNELIDKIYIYQ